MIISRDYTQWTENGDLRFVPQCAPSVTWPAWSAVRGDTVLWDCGLLMSSTVDSQSQSISKWLLHETWGRTDRRYLPIILLLYLLHAKSDTDWANNNQYFNNMLRMLLSPLYFTILNTLFSDIHCLIMSNETGNNRNEYVFSSKRELHIKLIPHTQEASYFMKVSILCWQEHYPLTQFHGNTSVDLWRA